MRREGDIYLDPKDGLYRKVIKLGPVFGVEVLHGYTPAETKARKAKPPKPAWTPAERNPFALAPAVEKFLLWRFASPRVRPKATDLTTRQKDRLLRLAVLDKRTNWNLPSFWDAARRDGLTDPDLKLALRREFQCSSVRTLNDRRRAVVYTAGKGARGPVFVIGEHPDEFVLEGAELLCAVRRAMNIKRIH